MAVHFSKEEEEKLKKNESEIYQEHDDDSIKEEIKNLGFVGKLKQFRDYYLKGTIVALIVIAMAVVSLYDYVNKDKVRLFIAIQGDVLEDEQIKSLEQDLNEYLGFKKGETVRLSVNGDYQQIQTYLCSGTIDLLITPESDFPKLSTAGYFFAANKNKEVKYYNQYQDYKVTSKFISGEDVRKNLKDTKIDPEDKTEYFFGLSLRDSESYNKEFGGMMKDGVVATSSEAQHLEEAEKVVKLLMDNNKSLKIKSKK